MKKLLALFLALLLCVTLLVACGGDDDTPNKPGNGLIPPAGDGDSDGDGTLAPDGGDNFASDIEWDGLLG